MGAPIPDISDLWAEKFVNAVPPVSPTVLNALAPKPLVAQPPVQPHPFSMATSAPTVGTQSPSVAGVTGAPIGIGIVGGFRGAPDVLAGGAASGTSRPSLSVGTLPPVSAANEPHESHSMPAWM